MAKGLIKQETGCHRNIIRAQQQQACNPGILLRTGHRDIVRAQQQQQTFNRGTKNPETIYDL